MRAARTPPEPPPMTKRSVSKSAMTGVLRLEIVAFLLHLGAKAVHHILTDALTPLLNIVEGFVEHLWLDRNHLFAEGRFVERQHVFEFLLAESIGVELCRLGH